MSSSIPADKAQAVQRFFCFQLDPIRDPRWAQLVENHPKASVFHSVAWLRTLCHTYGYEPVVFTTSPPPGMLKNGLIFCRINSWLTGRRLVSLPFSDHCEPLCDSREEFDFLIRHLQIALKHENWRYLEIRPVDDLAGQLSREAGFLPAATHFHHVVDLHSNLDEIFSGFDRDSVQRRVQRAERAGLTEERGRSKALLKQFYALFVATRGRHHLPPIPYEWFRNLIEYQGPALEIRLAYAGATPISAILTLKFRDVVFYKYGCSDARFNKFGATPWLLWRAIVAAKANGVLKFDLGRTEEGNLGLLTFKNHWMPQPGRLVYWKFPDSFSLDSVDGPSLKFAKRVFSCMPNSLLRITGRVIYRHIG